MDNATIKKRFEKLEPPLRWTCKSTRQLTKTLIGMGYQTSHHMVGELLRELGYSLQSQRS